MRSKLDGWMAGWLKRKHQGQLVYLVIINDWIVDVALCRAGGARYHRDGERGHRSGGVYATPAIAWHETSGFEHAVV